MKVVGGLVRDCEEKWRAKTKMPKVIQDGKNKGRGVATRNNTKKNKYLLALLLFLKVETNGPEGKKKKVNGHC